MRYAFRIRFALSPYVRLNTGPEESIAIAASAGDDVVLRALRPNLALQDAEQLVLLGRGYEDHDGARAAGARWRGFAERALARLNIAANFGSPDVSVGNSPR